MTLMNAPAYDKRKEIRNTRIFICALIAVFLAVVIGIAGYFTGHGWFFTDLPSEWRVGSFFTALEHGDYTQAYAIKMNDPDWQQHSDRYKDYPFNEFKEDWTLDSPVGGPIHSYHVDVSKRVGSGSGANIVVMVHVNGQPKPISVCVLVANQKLIDCPIALSY